MYHLIRGKLTANSQSGEVKTVEGSPVNVKAILLPIKLVNNASVIQPNMQASNGAIHVVAVLLPPNLDLPVVTALFPTKPKFRTLTVTGQNLRLIINKPSDDRLPIAPVSAWRASPRRCGTPREQLPQLSLLWFFPPAINHEAKGQR